MKAKPHRAFRSGEFALALLLIVALVAFVLARFEYYRMHAEKVAVRHMVAALKIALQVESARSGGARGPAGIDAFVDANPMALLSPEPANYLGEFYRPDMEEFPQGNWLYDRRDKTLIYLPFSNENFTFSGSRLLKFKVELTSSPEGAVTPVRGNTSVGLALIQVGGAQP